MITEIMMILERNMQTGKERDIGREREREREKKEKEIEKQTK